MRRKLGGYTNYFLGGFGTLLVMGHEWNPRYKWVRSMELLVNYVMPRLKGL